MKVDNNILRIIEDHALMVHCIDSICTALENDTDMPNFIPILHDTLVTDQLGKICEVFSMLKKKSGGYNC